MKDMEIVYKSKDGNYRVLYSMWDLGNKYKVQKKNEHGRWCYMTAADNPLSALNIMKRAAKEDI